MDVFDLEKSFHGALRAAMGAGVGGSSYDGTEKSYRNQILGHLRESSVRRAYIEPVLGRLLARARKETVDYDVALRAIRRAVGEAARNWKSTHVMSTGLTKAAIARQIDAVATIVMNDIYLPRLGNQSRQARLWRVHEGRPSWHQSKAGHASAASTTFETKEEAERYVENFKKHHPDEHVWIQAPRG